MRVICFLCLAFAVTVPVAALPQDSSMGETQTPRQQCGSTEIIELSDPATLALLGQAKTIVAGEVQTIRPDAHTKVSHRSLDLFLPSDEWIAVTLSCTGGCTSIYSSGCSPTGCEPQANGTCSKPECGSPNCQASCSRTISQ